MLMWVLFGLSLVLDILIVMVNISFSYSRLPYLLNLREEHQKAVERIIRLTEKPHLWSALILVSMLLHFLIAGLGIYIVNSLLLSLSLWWIIFYLLLGMLLLSILEFGIKSWVLHNPEGLVVHIWFIGEIIYWLFLPFSSLMVFILGPNVNRMTISSMTEEDLKNWVEMGQPEGSLEKGEREMIYSIFQFGDTLTREIMVPRIDVLALDIQSTLGEARETFVQGGHSRVPVYEDTVDNVVGLLYAKDLLSLQQDDDLIVHHRDLLRLAYFVPESKKADEVLAEMQTRNMHMAIVVDEYGGVAGVVTLEDIVEEIVGEIRDEYDESEELPYFQVGENEYIFQGRVDLNIFNEVMGTHIATDNADTIGGYIYGEFGDVPIGGEQVQADDVTLTVEQVDGRRIMKVRAKRLLPHSKVKDGVNAN